MLKNIFGNEEKKYLFAKKCIDETEGDKSIIYGSTSSSYNSLEFIDSNDDIDTLETTVYPTPVIFVLLSKTFEATAANGIRSVLGLFLRDSLMFDERFSIVILHTFNFFSQFLPIGGAILSDCYLGNARTISFFFIPYAIGFFGIFTSTLPYLFSIHSIVYTSLLLIAVGNGFIRACIASLGANQYQMPQQKKALDYYFSAYYFFYYAGILMGKILPPFVRTSVLITPYCLEKGQCYTSVFGVIALIFLISWILFLCGLKMYKKETPTFDNTILKTLDCISYSVIKKFSGRSSKKAFLDNGNDKYSQEFINDVKVLLKVMKLFLPLPVYYALLNQQDSTWTFQAALTDTNIFGITIQADQFKAIGPVLLLILIPVWQRIVSPLLEKFGIFLTSLECVFIGCIFASLSFVCAGFLQYFIFIDVTSRQYSVLWQLPQFVLIMIAEVLISIPGLKFAFTHAPSTMKSMLTAIFFINNALGNLIVVGITQLGLFKENHSMEFYFYAFLMLLAAVMIKILSDSHENETLVTETSEEQATYETFIYVDEAQTSNLEENYIRFNDDYDEVTT